MKNLSRDSWSPSLDFNPGLPKYEAGVPTTWLQRFIEMYIGIYHHRNMPKVGSYFCIFLQ
jgi:hypothetical protein